MKSIKILSKNLNTPRSQKSGFHTQVNYQQFIINSPTANLRQKLGSIFAEVCQQIQSKTNIKLKLYQNIKRWIGSSKNQQMNSVISQFRNFLFETFDFLLKNNNQWKKGKNDGQKIIRIKSEQRIKLRLLKQNQTLSGQLWQNDLQKQQQNKEKIIFELKGLNKNLERKILLLSSQFNKIKNIYEAKIQKYKKLLNTSLLNFQIQLEKQDENQHNTNNHYQRYSKIEKNSSPIRQSQLIIRKYPQSELDRKQSHLNKAQRLTTQQSQKFVTIPSLPIFQSTRKLGNRQFSQKYLNV